MAGRIKGITIEIGGNTTKLQKSLKEVDGTLKKTQQDLKDVNKLLKFNPRNVELMRQKQELLSKQVKETGDRLKQLNEAERQMKAQGVSKNSEQYKRLRREIIETESKLTHFKSQLNSFGSVGAQRIKALGNAFQATGNKITAAGRTVTTTISVWGASAIYTGKKLVEMSEVQTQAENKLIEVYRSRMGATKEAAKTTMQVASAIQKEGVIGDEVTLSGAQMLATFAKYPSTVNKLLPAMDNLLVQQKGLNATQEDATNVAKLFGKVLTGQTGALSKAGITFSDAQQEILKYGSEEEKAAVLAEVITENVGEMNKAFAKTDMGKIQQAKNDLGDLGETIGAVILPAFAKFAKTFSVTVLPVIQKFADFLQANPKIAEMAMKLAAVVAVLGPLTMLVGQIAFGIGSIMSVAPMILGVLNPAVGILAGLATVLLAVWQNSEQLRKAVSAAGEQIKAALLVAVQTATPALQGLSGTVLPKLKAILGVVGSALARLVPIFASVVVKFITGTAQIIAKINSILSTVKSVAPKIYTTFIQPFTNAYNKVKSIIDKIKSAFSNTKLKFNHHIDLPHFSLHGKFDAKSGSTPSTSVRWYKTAMQSGAILRNPTIFGAQGGNLLGGGEVGNEVIVGQNSLFNMVNHAVISAVTQMSNTLAGAVATAMQVGLSGNNATGQIVLQVYMYPSGPKMGEYIVDAYDTYKRRMG